jgi:hypothetical protein
MAAECSAGRVTHADDSAYPAFMCMPVRWCRPLERTGVTSDGAHPDCGYGAAGAPLWCQRRLKGRAGVVTGAGQRAERSSSARRPCPAGSGPHRGNLPPPLPDPPATRDRSGAPLEAWSTPRAWGRGADEGTQNRALDFLSEVADPVKSLASSFSSLLSFGLRLGIREVQSGPPHPVPHPPAGEPGRRRA